MDDEILKADEVGKRLLLSKASVYALARADEIPHFRVGRAVRFRWSSVVEWLEAKESAGERVR